MEKFPRTPSGKPAPLPKWLNQRDPDPQVVASSLMIAAAKWTFCLSTSDIDLLERFSSLHVILTIVARECFEQKRAALTAESQSSLYFRPRARAVLALLLASWRPMRRTFFTNGLDPLPRSRPVFNFPRPGTLAEWLAQPKHSALASRNCRNSTKRLWKPVRVPVFPQLLLGATHSSMATRRRRQWAEFQLQYSES